MYEVTFSSENNKRWKQTEIVLNNRKNTDPDLLAKLFVQLTDDLAYAQTYFPNSKTTKYLNQLTILAHQRIYISKRKTFNKLIKFFKYDYPFLISKHYKKLLYATVIFLFSVIIGALSGANDENFLRIILGDEYVNQTIDNIEKGKPLDVYSKMKPFPMFLTITFNNIKVAFFAFSFGVFFSIGTGIVLFKNGIMLGAFQYFFHSKNLLLVSAMGIWMHGTIEIFSIVVAGMAGLVVGNSLLFPGTFSRKHSFQKGAMEGIKIVFGLIPFFFIAGFIESYLTRHSEIKLLSIVVIMISIFIIAYYFFIYPYILKRKLCYQKSI
ncbi:MAG: stage II sporulation protein M [Bacteroidales bacterium]|nr:stage II sporulation protein M [Bacteroidales bacterium]